MPRGRLFENNALNIGPLSIRDPQTGHYLAELPLDPRMLSMPEILTGVHGALEHETESYAIAARVARAAAGHALSAMRGSAARRAGPRCR